MARRVPSIPPEVFEAARAGDGDARQRIVTENLGLVRSVVSRYARHSSGDREELEAEGALGLLSAIERFDPRRGFRFSTYAVYWIQNFVRRAFSKQSLIWVPQNLRDEQSRRRGGDRRKANRNLERRLSDADNSGNLVHLDEMRGADRDLSAADLFPDEDPMQDPANAAEAASFGDEIRPLLAKMPDRVRQIVEMRFGIIDGFPKTLDEVGHRFAISRERVRQIEKKAVDCIRRGEPFYIGGGHKQKKSGRSSRFTPALQEALLSAMSRGPCGTVQEACAQSFVDIYWLVYRRSTDRQFRERYDEALAEMRHRRYGKKTSPPLSI